MLALDLVNTVAVAGVVLFAGYGLRRAIPLLARLNLPAPVVGGLVVAIAMTIAHGRGVQLVRFDTTLQTPLQNAFFTSIGFAASYQLLKLGGPLVLRFFIFAASIAILQNVVGAAVALALGQEPLLGVLAGSVTLTGGPATGLAFAPLFEQAGVTGAATVAVAAAMAGIVCGGLVGAPLATMLLERGNSPSFCGGAHDAQAVGACRAGSAAHDDPHRPGRPRGGAGRTAGDGPRL